VIRTRLRAAGVLAVLLVGAACGKRGNPLPPLRPLPARVADAAARRVGDHVELRFTIPATNTNTDSSTPSAVTRLDIYAAVGPLAAGGSPSIPIAALSQPIATSKPMSVTRFPAVRWATPAPNPAAGKRQAVPPTTAAQLLRPEFLRGHIDVKPPPPPPAADSTGTPEPAAPAKPAAAGPPAAPDTRPGAGDVTTFADDVTKDRASATSSDRAVLRYIIVPVAGRNRFSTPSAVLEVPLRLEPAAPPAPVLTNDESTLKIVWTAGAAGEKFRVYRSDASGKEQPPALTTTPLAVAEFATPVEFGVERCFIVRSVAAAGAVSIESEASPPACKTALDTFPPAAPKGLFAQPFENRISLGWSPVDASDLAGYLVLRADGDDPIMRPLMTAPISEVSFVDATTKVGTRYTYIVIAVDKAGNRSAESNRVAEIGR